MNKVLLSEDRLQLILEKHKGSIGNKSNWSNVITGITFIISTLSAQYSDFAYVSGEIIKTVFLVVASIATCWGILMEITKKKDQFNQEKLFEEMKVANEIEHPFSIVAIKDTFEKYPNKFLLYYDNRWKCWFFFNFRTNDDTEKNEQSIKNGLSSRLKIDVDSIDLEFKDETIHCKYSESDKVKKYYHHSLYNCVIKNFGEELKKDKFTIDNVDYKWMTIDEMEKNPSIKVHNLDVVEFVKHNNV